MFAGPVAKAAGFRYALEVAMVARPRQPCTTPGCPNLKPCSKHPPAARQAHPKPWAGRPPANERGYDWRWARLRAQVLAEEPNCRECGRPSETVDHIIPLARGGSNDRSNLRGLCGACARRKNAADAAAGRRLANQRRSRSPRG